MYYDIWSYTRENVSEIMNRELIIVVKKYGSNEVKGELARVIIDCVLAHNFPHQPISFSIKTENGIKNLSIAEIGSIEDSTSKI